MKMLPVGLLLALVGSAVAHSAPSGSTDIVIRPQTKVAGIDLGGLTVPEAEKRVRVWWEEQKVKQLELRSEYIRTALPKVKASEIGISLDDVATISRLPVQDATAPVTGDLTFKDYSPVYKADGFPSARLLSLIHVGVGEPRPARVIFYKGAVFREPEITAPDLSEAGFLEAVDSAIKGDGVVHLPIVEHSKRIPDEKLAEITDVVASFSTRFPKRQYSRNSNIRLASSKLNGVVILPGEKLSFNGTVGERTIAKGFKLAGVYKNGRHDTGIGGGICQVSTTLYNACIFSDLKIVRRSNHSMPVAYVPLGRDATVDYGNLDLVVQNDRPYPIAISSSFEPGKLTFRVLGKKEPGLTVKLMQVGGKSWDMGTRIIQDPKMKVGDRDVVEKGSRGHSLTTYRLVYKNGVLQDKQILNHSYYGGGERIVAVGAAAPVGIAPTKGVVPPITAAAPPRH